MPVSRIAGTFWFLAAALFIGSSCLLFLDTRSWWIAAAAGVVCSQTLVILSWKDAKYGTALNLVILLPVLIAFMGALPSSFGSIYRAEATKRLVSVDKSSLITESDIRHLPPPVQKYLQRVGAVGRPKVRNFRAAFRGELRRSMTGDWMEITARQHNFFGDHTRLFYIESALYCIPFDGLHLYSGDSATMQIRIASAFQIVHARGDEMNQTETVTLFNDMCLLAPATLIDTSIQWNSIDSVHVGAAFTNRGHTIRAILSFGPTGELTDFISEDRYMSWDGTSYHRYPWSTPVKNYRDFGGGMAAAYAEAIWHTPQGEYVYAKFNLSELEYNATEFR